MFLAGVARHCLREMSKDSSGRIVDLLAHPICLAVPRRLTALRSWHEHIPFAMLLVDLLRPRVLVELGVHAGDSYCAFCQTVQGLSLDTRCYGVDTWQVDARSGSYEAGVLDDLRAHHDPLYGSFSILIRSTFDDALGRFADGTIGLLHIDGDHSHEAVKHDFESWLPKMSAEGVVLLHDTNGRERDFGIRRFWDEIEGQYRSFEFPHGHGLGVLAVGDVRSPELGAMFDARPDDAETIRVFFAQLGHRVSLTDDVDAVPGPLETAHHAPAARARPAPSLIGPRDPPEANRETHNLLQLFWDDGGEFSQAHSLTTPLVADDQIHQYVLRLPSTARGPLRLDPGHRAAYVEIHGIELGASHDDEGVDGEIVCRWSAAPDDARLIAVSDMTRLSGHATYRFICTGEDPQLMLDRVPERADSRPWFMRVTLRASERVFDVLADEIRVLERERARLAVRADAVQSLAMRMAVRRDVLAAALGWRVLSRYRSLKDRVVRPLRRMGDAWEALARRTYHPALQPMRDLQGSDGSGVWESTGRDPQFNVAGPWPRGWTEVALEMAPESRLAGCARLYVDRGAGYSESDTYELGEGRGYRTRFVPLGPEVIALRLDPCESTGRFGIHAFTLKRATVRRAAHANGWRGTRRQSASASAEPRLVAAAGGMPRALDPYEAWLEVNVWNARRAALLGERLSAMTEPPLLSVVMPVYDAPPEFLDRAIASVAGQVYQNWELCIADDASTDPAVRERLQHWVERERRIRVLVRDTNGGISRATNSAADVAGGEFLVLMDHDDELTPDALGEVALYFSEHPETDILYSDDDKIDAQGRRFAPQFKPDWSPELLLSYMYWSHLLVVRRGVFVEAGGLRVGYEGSQDYDLALRVTEVTDRVGHIPKILYHWRAVPGSTAAVAGAKPESFRAGLRAVQDAFDRRGVLAVAHQPEWARKAGCGIFSHEFPDEGPRVAVIIPTKNNFAVLKSCLESLAKTTYKNYEIVIVDNGSEDAETLDVLRRTRHRVLRIPSPPEGFSFAAINNRAVEQVDADLVLFLNDDTEVLAPEWLSQMVGYLGLPGVGAVGARLRFPDGRLQHAGIVHGYYHGLAGLAFKLLPASTQGYLDYARVARNYSAVTAACLLTRRELFLGLGGFDALRFAVAYNDVDYCYRLGAAGYRVVYCPTAELIHHEGASRGFADNPAEPAAFHQTYGARRDPFYNSNLSLRDERFAIDARTLAPARIPPIRALMCAFTLNWEGAPYSQLELTVRLKEDGVIDPVVYCPEDGPLRAAYEARGIRVEFFQHPLWGVHESPAYERAIARFAEWIAALDVELVYANTRETFYAIEAAKRRGLPSLWNPRESEPWQTYFEGLGADIAPRALACFGYPYKVVFVADATRQRYAGLDAHHNFMTIHTGLDRERFIATLDPWPRGVARQQLELAPDETMVLLLGTVSERKGQLDLIEAVARLDKGSASTIRCFVVGDRATEYSARVRKAWHALPAARRSRVEIVAETAETGLYYAASDVFVCTSRVESFPRVILEAMAAGLPIITTPVYGIAEQVRENVNALCYAPGDVRALAGHLERLSREPRLRQTLADNSRHVLDTLNDFDSMVAAYADVFREAWLSGRSR